MTAAPRSSASAAVQAARQQASWSPDGYWIGESTIHVVWELSDAVPDQVRAFWSQRVLAVYETEQYAVAFEEAFRVLELAAVMRSREAGGPDRHFRNAVDWLLARSIIKPRHHCSLPGELWTEATRARNRFSHHQTVEFPMVLNRASCDVTFGTFANMLDELWEPARAIGP